jgi:hypothetical protein
MRNRTKWPIWSKFLVGALLIYSGLLCALGLHIFSAAVWQSWQLKVAGITVQTLTIVFLPLLLLGLWKPRLTSGLLFGGAVINLAMTLSVGHGTPDEMTGIISASLLFLGVPMLGSAILLHCLSRPAPPASQ